MCAGSDADRNHGLQHRFRQSDCLSDDWLLRRYLTAPSHRCPGHRWSDGHGRRRTPPLRLRLFNCASVARQPFTSDFVYSDGCALGKRELDWRLPPRRFVVVPVARRFRTAHGSAVFPRRRSVPAAAARSCWRPRRRRSVRPRGRGAAGGPSAGAAEPGLRNPLAASVLRPRRGRSPVLHSSQQCVLQARAGLGHCCLIMRSWRPRSRHSVRPRGRGAAGGPSAEP